jgi:hypothetical protein
MSQTGGLNLPAKTTDPSPFEGISADFHLPPFQGNFFNSSPFKEEVGRGMGL